MTIINWRNGHIRQKPGIEIKNVVLSLHGTRNIYDYLPFGSSK